MANRLGHIDALRGLAMLWIIAYHVYDSKDWILPDQLGMFFQQGYFAVQLFLILSAFSIFYSLTYAHSRDGHRYKAFFIRRFFRIAPLFYFAIVLYLWLDGWGPRETAPQGLSWFNVLSAALFLGSWWPTSTNSVPPGGWVVSVEWMFYLMVPLIFTRIKNSVRALGATLLGFGMATASYLALANFPWIPSSWQQNLWEQFLWYWLPTQLPILCLGIVLFYARRSKKIAFAALVSSLLLLASLILVFYDSAGWYFEFPLTPRYMFFGLAFVLLVYGVEAYPIIVNKVTIYLGKISYSCYLLQFALLNRVPHRMEPIIANLLSNYLSPSYELLHPVTTNIVVFTLIFSSVLASTILVASITYRLIEIPGMMLGRTLSKKMEKTKERKAGLPHTQTIQKLQ